MASYKEVVEKLRTNFKSGITTSTQYRIEQLKRLKRLYDESENELVEALKHDLGKPSAEAINFEIDFNKLFVRNALASLEKYAGNIS